METGVAGAKAALGRRARRVAWLARREDQRQIHKTGDKVDPTEAGNRTAHEVVGQQRPEGRPPDREIVVIPEGRPRQHEEQQTDFEEERHVDQPANQDLTLASAPC